MKRFGQRRRSVVRFAARRFVQHQAVAVEAFLQMRDQRLELYELPNYTSRKNRRNNYGYNVQEQATQTYTGMGMDINVHDQWAVESQGRIQDRTREHLGTTDKGIIMKVLKSHYPNRYDGKKAAQFVDALKNAKPDSQI